jgi:hypothetical protein
MVTYSDKSVDAETEAFTMKEYYNVAMGKLNPKNDSQVSKIILFSFSQSLFEILKLC